MSVEAESKDGSERGRHRGKKPGIFRKDKALHRLEASGSIQNDREFPIVPPGAAAQKESSLDAFGNSIYAEQTAYNNFIEEHESKLAELIRHRADTFSEYLLYLIKEKGLTNTEVYKNAIVDKKTFSKIKNNADYHPQKLTALCLCIGAKLNLDESKDLLTRAGYALSPCDKTDIIFSFFIENEIYDMIELDIQLEEHGLPCIIT